jgi:hypothetical protein
MSKITTKCKHCSNIFEQYNLSEKYQKKFCNHSCAATFNNIKRGNASRKMLSAQCLHCNKEFTYRESHQKGLYCSHQCQRDYAFSTTITQKVLTGASNVGVRTRKKVLSKIKGYCCSICNLKEWMNKPITLQLDHIDGNSDNNDIDNLRLLCPNCHSQTETFCARNIKNLKKNPKYTKRNSYNRNYYKNGTAVQN